MKKKILTLCLVVALAATAVIGGTLAYFTDTDADVNVMTTGNLKIVQNETERDGSEYVDGQTLLPAVYFDENGKTYNPTTGWEGPKGGVDGTCTGPDGEQTSIYDKSLNNEIDKIVSVTNGGNVDAYIRTIVLLEDNDSVSDNLHIVYSDTNVCAREVIDQVKVGDEYYEAWIFTYNEKVEAGKTSKASLKQVWLDPMTDNGWYDMLGDDGAFTILAFSQATQVAGFEDLGAEVALDAAFGDVTDTAIAEWVNATGIKTTDRNNVVGVLN